MFHEIDKKREGGEFALATKMGNIFFLVNQSFKSTRSMGQYGCFFINLHSGNYMSFNLYADLHTGQNINPIPLPSEGCKRLLIENMKNIST